MARQPRPWYRRSADAWYVTVKGKQRLLARGKASKKAAVEAFHLLMAGLGKSDRPGGPTVAELCETFLDHASRSVRPRSYETYRRYLLSFVKVCGGLSAATVQPKEVTRWLEGETGWGTSCRNLAVAVVKRAFRWADQEGHIEGTPLRKLKRPPMRRRERLLTRAEIEVILGSIRDQPFRDYLTALIESGCRPGEAAIVEAKNIDFKAGTWTIEFKGNRQRVIYMTPALSAICCRLAAEHPEGTIFRNTLGNPWTRAGYGQRFRALRRRLGLGEDLTVYHFRHAWITDGLVEGVPAPVIAELAGHKSLKMIAEVYSKVRDKKDHLRDAVRIVRPGKTDRSGDE